MRIITTQEELQTKLERNRKDQNRSVRSLVGCLLSDYRLLPGDSCILYDVPNSNFEVRVIELSCEKRFTIRTRETVLTWMLMSPSCKRRKGEVAIDIPNSIYFGGAGWGGAFYIGVYKALAERWGPDFASKTSVNISGDSAGVFWAIAVALGFRPDEVDAIFRKQSFRAATEGQWLGRNTLYLKDVVTELLSRDLLAYKKLEGRFSTATTCFPFTHTRHCKWTSNSDLIDCVLGSLHIPFYCSRIKPVRGANVVDGAYSICGHHLVDGDRTLFIGKYQHITLYPCW